LWGAYVMGSPSRSAGTPCIGPILAAILAVAASKARSAKGAAAARSIRSGSACRSSSRPFAVQPSPPSWRAFAPICATWSGCWAAFLVLTGIAFLAGFFSQLNSWLLEAFPVLQSNRITGRYGISV